jgi:Asp/Glu/hydantoin racemase
MKIGLIHTSEILVPVFQQLCEELIPSVDTINIADDSLLRETMAHGGTNKDISHRLQDYISHFERSGAEAIMVTCSSLGPVVDEKQGQTNVPLLRVDQAMAEKAVSLGNRIGVIATVATTLRPTAGLIERHARSAGKSVEVSMVLCDGALQMLLDGDHQGHDKAIARKLFNLMPKVEVIVLAQASMTRVLQSLPSHAFAAPILSSPRLAIEALARSMQLGPAT